MGAVLLWLGVGLVITLVLLAAWTTDRRARRMGHHLWLTFWGVVVPFALTVPEPA